MSDIENPRATIGDNNPPDQAQIVIERLTSEYAGVVTQVDEALERARHHPKIIENDTVLGEVATTVKALRDVNVVCDSHHEAEKQPYLRAGQAVDQFFFSLMERLGRRSKTGRPGAIDILMARINDYQTRKLEAERIAREEIARKAAAAEAAARAEADRLRKEAEYQAAALERARAPHKIEEKTAIAENAAAAAQVAQIDAMVARDQAEAADFATRATPADMVRTRVEGGSMVTMGRVPYVEMLDAELLNKELLWPFISDKEKERALKAWARTTSHTKPMAGTIIEMRHGSTVR